MKIIQVATMNDIKKLIYVPILHAREEVGQKAGVLRGDDVGSALARDPPAALSTQPLRASNRPQADILHNSAVDEMWAGIAAKIKELSLPWNRTRIYLDGLPVCGEERRIVEELAGQGSGNHRLVLDLLRKGAQVEGTEDMDLLMREYDLLNVLLMKLSDADPSAILPLPAIASLAPAGAWGDDGKEHGADGISGSEQGTAVAA